MWSKELEKYFCDSSKNTLKRYRAVINEFCGYIGVPINKATCEDVLDYYDFLRDKKGIIPRVGDNNKVSGRTIRNTMHLLAAFYAKMLKRGLVQHNIFEQAGIRLPHETKNEKRPTEMLAFDKVAELCTAPSRTTKKGVRDRAILAMIRKQR